MDPVVCEILYCWKDGETCCIPVGYDQKPLRCHIHCEIEFYSEHFIKNYLLDVVFFVSKVVFNCDLGQKIV